MNVRLNKTSKISIIILLILAGLTFTLNTALSAAEYLKGAPPLNKIQISPQYKAGKFSNALAWNETPSFKTMLNFMFGKEQRTPKETLPQNMINLQHFNSPDTNQLNVTNIGHSSLMINIDGYRILTDPVFEAKLTLVGPTRFNKELPLDIHQLEDIDYVLISHNHYDHLNKFSIQFLNQKVKQFIVPLAVGAQLQKWGIPSAKITELDWWDELQLTDNLLVVSTPSQHFSGRGLTDRNKTLWTSYVIQTDKHKVYFSGDSGYFDGFKEIGDKYGPFDITFLECGAYNLAWSFIHMFPEETVQAALDLKARYLFPVHWGAFNLSLHDWFDPMQRVTVAAQESGVPLLTPVFGQTIYYPDGLNTPAWWTEYLPASNQNITQVSNFQFQP